MVTAKEVESDPLLGLLKRGSKAGKTKENKG